MTEIWHNVSKWHTVVDQRNTHVTLERLENVLRSVGQCRRRGYGGYEVDDARCKVWVVLEKTELVCPHMQDGEHTTTSRLQPLLLPLLELLQAKRAGMTNVELSYEQVEDLLRRRE